MPDGIVRLLGLVGGVALPLWNIPFMMRIRHRQSSKDISLSWTVGVLVCLLLMVPSALTSADVVFKLSTIVNVLCFSGVVTQVVRYR